MPSSHILRVHQLTVERGTTRILQGIDWAVEPGQHWSILGANGSGKTSLLKALTGYLMPSSGSLELLGQVYGESDWRELRQHVGLISASISQRIPVEETALETVVSGRLAMIGLWHRITPRERAAALALMRQMGCAELARRRWEVLSQGERQRILIARALMSSPAVLILDEPCAGLDPVAREHFLAFLQRLVARKKSPTLILVTHHVEEILPEFQHVLVLKAGRVLAAGPKSRILTGAVMSGAFGPGVSIRRVPGGHYRLMAAKIGLGSTPACGPAVSPQGIPVPAPDGVPKGAKRRSSSRRVG